jgi:hypothetical protein
MPIPTYIESLLLLLLNNWQFYSGPPPTHFSHFCENFTKNFVCFSRNNLQKVAKIFTYSSLFARMKKILFRFNPSLDLIIISRDNLTNLWGNVPLGRKNIGNWQSLYKYRLLEFRRYWHATWRKLARARELVKICAPPRTREWRDSLDATPTTFLIKSTLIKSYCNTREYFHLIAEKSENTLLLKSDVGTILEIKRHGILPVRPNRTKPRFANTFFHPNM